MLWYYTVIKLGINTQKMSFRGIYVFYSWYITGQIRLKTLEFMTANCFHHVIIIGAQLFDLLGRGSSFKLCV